MSSETQFRKGVLEMCVLNIISKEKAHGYDIIKRMSEHFPEVSGSNIYAILRRLSKEKCVQMTCCDEGKGPTRKNYEITEQGVETYNKFVESWHKVRRAVDAISNIE